MQIITISGPEIISARYGDSEKAVRDIPTGEKGSSCGHLY